MFQGVSKRVLGGVIVSIITILLFVCMYFEKINMNTCIGILCVMLIIGIKYIRIPVVEKQVQIDTTFPGAEILSDRPPGVNEYVDPNISSNKSILGLIYNQTDSGSFKDKPILKDT